MPGNDANHYWQGERAPRPISGIDGTALRQVRLGNQQAWQRLVYQRPSFTGNWQAFGDLLRYAPGMNTSWADVRAVVEAEAAPDPAAAPGRIDAEAARLVERARGAGWRSVTIDPPPPNRAGSNSSRTRITSVSRSVIPPAVSFSKLRTVCR